MRVNVISVVDIYPFILRFKTAISDYLFSLSIENNIERTFSYICRLIVWNST